MTVTGDIKAYIEANITLDKVTISKLIADDTATFNTVVSVNQTLDSGPEYVMRNQIGVRNPRVQIFCRANDYPTAEAKALEVFDLLKSVCNQTVNGNLYISITPMSEPVPIDRDELKRVIFSTNYEVSYQ